MWTFHWESEKSAFSQTFCQVYSPALVAHSIIWFNKQPEAVKIRNRSSFLHLQLATIQFDKKACICCWAKRERARIRFNFRFKLAWPNLNVKFGQAFVTFLPAHRKLFYCVWPNLNILTGNLVERISPRISQRVLSERTTVLPTYTNTIQRLQCILYTKRGTGY